MKIKVRKPSEIKDKLKGKRICFDIETLNTNLETETCLISIFDTQDQDIYIIPVQAVEHQLSQEERDLIPEIFKSVQVMTHYGQFDNSQILQEFGINPVPYADTFILACMLGEPKMSLKDLGKKYFPKLESKIKKFTEVSKIDDKGNFTYSLRDKDMLFYSALDAYLPYLVHKEMEKHKYFKTIQRVYQIEMRFMQVVAEWRANGLNFDIDQYYDVMPILQSDLERDLQELYNMAGREFKLNSPKDLQKLLFQEHGLVPVLTTKTGAPSTNAEALAYFEGNPLVDKLTQVKSNDSVFRASKKVPQFIDSKGHLRFEVKQVGFDGTGRVYTKDTSVNQLPKEMRKAIKPRDGYKFLYFDLSSAELYLLAYYAECLEICEWYENGIDVHARIGERLLGRPLKDKSEREISKVCSFATLYGSKGAAVSRRLKVSQQEGERLVEGYLNAFPEIVRYREKMEDYTIKTGYTKTPLGRVRKLSYPGDTNPGVLRQSLNTAIQSGLADFVKYMMARAYRLKERDIHVKFSVFDSVLLEVPKSMDEEKAKKVLDFITDVSKLEPNLKFNYEYAFGDTWYEAQSKC